MSDWTLDNGLVIDPDKDAGLGECLVLGCHSPVNVDPCCFCAEHCATHGRKS